MKTIAPLLVLLCFVIRASGQAPTPDLSFEKWESSTFMGKSYHTVWGWLTNNMTNIMSGDEETAEASLDAFDGDYALRLINKPNGTHMSTGAITLNPTADNEFNDKFPISSRITSITGYYQYLPADGDSCSIYVMVYKNGVNIGYGEFVGGGIHNNYEAFTATVDYYDQSIPDSFSIAMFVSRDGFHEGSILTVDKLSLQSATTGIGEKSKPTFLCEVSPNPSQGMFNLTVEQLQKGNTTIYVYDLLGNRVKQFHNTWEAGSQLMPINCSDLKQGLYLLKIEQAGTEKTIRISIQ